MKNKTRLFAGLLAITFSACTNNEYFQEEHSYGKKVTINAYAPENNIDTRLSIDKTNQNYWSYTWDNDDTISVIRGGVNSSFIKAEDGKNTFIGELPGATGTFYATYPQNTDATDYKKVPFDISNAASCPTYMYSLSYDGIAFRFNHAMAYLQLSFTDLTDTLDLTVSLPYGVYTSGTMDLTQNGKITYNDNSKRTITLSNISLSEGTDFFAIPPMKANKKTLSIQIKHEGKTYQGTLTGTADKAIEAGKYYTATATLTEVVPAAVDMGLSVKWASFNVGATKPEEYGDYFAWGEIEPKAIYNWKNYKHSDGTDSSLKKYGYKEDKGVVDSLSTLEDEDDAAKHYWGGSWRMPTKEEWTELVEKCTWEPVDTEGIKGYKVTAQNGNYIFLPAAGYYYTQNGNLNYECSYWSSSLYNENDNSYGTGQYAWRFQSDKNINHTNRANGHSIRPVCEFCE